MNAIAKLKNDIDINFDIVVGGGTLAGKWTYENAGIESAHGTCLAKRTRGSTKIASRNSDARSRFAANTIRGAFIRLGI